MISSQTFSSRTSPVVPVRVNHSKNAIVKPQAKSATAEKREVEQAMKKVKEASQLIETVIDPGERGSGWWPQQNTATYNVVGT